MLSQPRCFADVEFFSLSSWLLSLDFEVKAEVKGIDRLFILHGETFGETETTEGFASCLLEAVNKFSTCVRLSSGRRDFRPLRSATADESLKEATRVSMLRPLALE